MKIKLTLILILLITMTITPSFANSKTVELEKKLENSNGVDRAKLLNTLAELLIEIDPEKSLKIAQEALVLSEDLNLSESTADSMNNLGYALFRQGAHQEAVAQFQSAIAKSEATGYNRGMAFGRNGYGLVWSAINDYPRALDDFERANLLFKTAAFPQGEAYTLNNMGTVYQSSGDYEKALESYLSALRINENLNNNDEIATTYNNIGSINAEQKHFEAAFEYYSKALTLYESEDNDYGRADALMNLGGFFQDFGYVNESIDFFNKALKLSTDMDSKPRIASALNALGYSTELMDNYPTAVDYYTQALQLGESIGNQEIAVNARNNIGTVYNKSGNFQAALENHIQAFETSKKIVYEMGLESSLKNIANDYQAMGNFKDANHYFILYNELRDALNDREQSRNFANLQTLYETEKKDQRIAVQQTEIIEKENRSKILIGIVMVVLLVLGITAVLAYLIAKEKKRSETLLLNILPAKVAEDLKKTGKTEPERFEAVTILFSDIVDFTNISRDMDPHTLIHELNDLFTEFDAIMDKNRCQRIKTIGDAYFAVCGLPDPDPDHITNIVNAAKEILVYLEERNRSKEISWKIRIGIHTGPVVGGVVGVKKYIYDIFGDTVNTASRMETFGASMKINISETTRLLLGDAYTYEEREPFPVKGKGIYKMFFLN